MPAKRKAATKAATDGTPKKKKEVEVVAKGMFSTPEMMPRVVKPPRLEIRLEQRREYAPNKLAKNAGMAHAMDVCKSKRAAAPAGGWATVVGMPDETKAEDVGWKPGPRLVGNKVPKFSGAPCGLNKEKFPNLTKDSGAFDFMETQITRENKIEIMNMTANARDNHFLLAKTRGKPVTSKYKLSLNSADMRGNPDFFDCWLVARVLIGQYNMSVPQKELWEPHGPHCHARLVGCLRYDQFRCMNKFLTLSDGDGTLLTEEQAKAIVAAEVVKAAAKPGVVDGAGGADGAAGTSASHMGAAGSSSSSSGGGGGGGAADDDADEDDEVQLLELGKVTERHGKLIYVAREDESVRSICARQVWDENMVLADNKDIRGLTMTVGLQSGTELCVGLGVGWVAIESSDDDDDDDDDGGGEAGAAAAAAATAGPEGVPRSDRIRKRRYMEMKIRGNWQRAYHPHEALSLDEMVREHKHWHCKRIKFKPNVHSGVLVDALTCARTKYCLWSEEQGTDPDGATTVPERCVRLCKKAGVAGKHHTVHLDRGYATMAAIEALSVEGVLSNACCKIDRVGLPREAIALSTKALMPPAKKKNGDDCKTKTSSDEQWSYTVYNKGEWELTVWADKQVVVFLTNSYTAANTGLLKRALQGNRSVVRVDVPEPCWSYNVFGRSGTDGHDQHRKDGRCDARRTLRDGVKGSCFLFDICIVNGYALKRSLQPGLTKLQFVDDYIAHVLTKMTLRKYNTKYAAQTGELPTALRGSAHKHVFPQKTVVQAWEKAPGVAKRQRQKGDKYIQLRGRCKHCSDVGTDVTKHKTIITNWRCDHADCKCWVHPDCFYELSQHQ